MARHDVKLNRLFNLHTPSEREAWGEDNSTEPYRKCMECKKRYPCPTIKIVQG